MLRRLIYTSRSLQPLPLDLKDILASSRKNNPAMNVTGALCFANGTYLQYLEGEAAALDRLYARIEKDPRHTGTKILTLEPTTKRLFTDWSMALLTWNDETRAIFEFFMPGTEIDFYNVDPVKAALLVEALSISSNWSEA